MGTFYICVDVGTFHMCVDVGTFYTCGCGCGYILHASGCGYVLYRLFPSTPPSSPLFDHSADKSMVTSEEKAKKMERPSTNACDAACVACGWKPPY